jgi:2-methylfumaryl-CoA hydratase
MQQKINPGRYFEDFQLGEVINHPLPRTVSEGDSSLYLALTGSRFVLSSSDLFAQSLGYEKRPLDDVLMFHIVFGKSVTDISLNAVANLGYAEVSFDRHIYAGDTVRLSSKVIGLKENSSGKNGNVYVHSTAYNQHDEQVCSFKRWVMVHKKDHALSTGIKEIPDMLPSLPITEPDRIPHIQTLDCAQTGSTFFWEDYSLGERLNHPEGMTIDDADHTFATRLYQNNAKLHFDNHLMQSSKMGQRLVYGGHVISLCRSQSFNGFGNALWLYAINAGTHCNPTFAGDTIYSFSEVLEAIPLQRQDLGLLRLRTVGLKNTTPDQIDKPKNEAGKYQPTVVLDLDYTIIMPRKSTQQSEP